MADAKLQGNISQSPDQQGQQVQQEQKDISKHLESYGGFYALKGFIPDAADMNPAKKAAKNIFLSEQRFKEKRERLMNELNGWLEILSQDKTTASEYANACKENEIKYKKILNQGITDALEATHELETSYRALDAFFKNAGTDKVTNLKIINVKKEDIDDADSGFSQTVDTLLKNAFDRLSLKDSYSLLVIPGYVFKDKPTMLKWAAIAFKYKVLLVTDHANERTFDDMKENTSSYKDSDQVLQNLVVTANWIVGRESEKLSFIEQDEVAFFVPPSGALAGKLYDDTNNMAQGAGGKKYGTLTDVKGVKLDMLKSEIAALWDNQVVPIVFSEGRVMAFNNTNLYNGDNDAMKEYPIVRVFDWIKKVLMNYVHEVALENWDPYNSPDNLKSKIQDFLNTYQGHGKLFHKYNIKEPKQDPITKRITVDVDITPYFAAKNFIIKLAADKSHKECDIAEK